MSQWSVGVIVIIIAMAFVPLIINGVAAGIEQGIDGISHFIKGVFDSGSRSGDVRLQGLIKLCLYLVCVVFLVDFICQKVGRKDGTK